VKSTNAPSGRAELARSRSGPQAVLEVSETTRSPLAGLPAGRERPMGPVASSMATRTTPARAVNRPSGINADGHR